MSRDEAIVILRRYALLDGTNGGHDYLPKTEKDAKSWMPHEWVIMALVKSTN